MAVTIQTVVGEVELNHETMKRLLDGDLGMAAVLQAEGSKILATAQATAPVVTGNYLAHMFMRTAHTDRMLVQVGNSVWYANAVEKKHSVLTKALGASIGVPGRNKKRKK